MNTAWEQFQGAALQLARSGSIKDRLIVAYRDHLSNIIEDELPREVRDRFHSVRCSLTRERPQFGEDAIRASVRKMSSREADQIACCVVEMLTEVARAQQPAAGLARNPATTAPLYLVEA